MYPNTMGQRIEYYRTQLGLNQKELAEKLHLAKSTMSQYESDSRNPSDEIKLALCELFHISMDELMGRQIKPEPKNGFAVPVLTKIAVGIPIDAIQEVDGWEELPKAMAGKGEFFALKVKGDSMSPTIIDGSVVIVRKQNSVENKEIAVVQINGDEEATIKRIQKQEHGLTLIGDNALVYPPHYYSEEQVRSLPVRILGKVVEARKML
ncbi:MAG: helix-turn-helix domain-containing protein [Acidaminococcaceae bacterium]|nr:helix-turn-helix domain-containing protein [Acidaminococcaceae bacterium]